ncbi:hypothetical protein PR048_013933 [Dryococelus australis]|uniref:Secreted protein n=1 Tax=Dryococelus australis TaxID=614101 RepID=A0ABQ9HTJ5_9NEOP|nr:hypothetical protein PR048_013933 [Dryococelus australis]
MQMSASMKLLMRSHLVLLQLLNPARLDSAPSSTGFHQTITCASNAPVDNEDESDNVLTENDTNTSLFGRRNCFEWKSKPLSCATQTIRHNVIKVRLEKLEEPARTLGDSPSAEQVWR